MSRIKQLRQLAAQQGNGPGEPTVRRLEEFDEEQALQPGEEAAPAEAPTASAPTAMEGEVNASAEAAVPSAGSAPSGLVMGGVTLGAISLAAVAATGGSGAKSGDSKPPIAEVPKPEIPRPLPEPPKPGDGHPPAPETPKPEDGQKPPPDTPKPDVDPPKPEEPGKPETPVNPGPDTPATPGPEEPTTPAPQAPPAPTVALTVDSGRSASDRYTNQADVTVTGLAPTASWKYSLDGGKTWVNGNVEGTIAASEFASGDGNKSVSVIQIDAAGNVSEPATLDFFLDTTKPETYYIGLKPIGDNNSLLEFYPTTTIAKFDRLLQHGLSIQWSCLGGVWRDVDMDQPGYFYFDFYEGLSASVDRIRLEYRIVDQAGNSADNIRGEYFNGVAKLAPPPIPTVELRSDSDASADDRITNDATLLVKGLVEGMSWKYSLDNGVTWKTGGADHQIAASEFGGIPGLKNVQVVQVNASNKESAAAHFDFTLQPDDVTGAHGATISDPTLFTGTGGMDNFKVNAADGKNLSIAGYNKSHGDVIDLSAVMTIPDGAELPDYIGGLNGEANSNWGFSINPTGNPSVDPKDVLTIDLGIYAARPQVTILYNGGETVI